jgi:hypothetical protein
MLLFINKIPIKEDFMKLSTYFENTGGTGIMATSDSKGQIDAALYSKPYFLDEDKVAFLMADRLTHKNLQDNPHAAFLFSEGDSTGKRLYLTKTDENQDSELIDKILRWLPDNIGARYRDIQKYVVYFHIDQVRPLVGDAE